MNDRPTMAKNERVDQHRVNDAIARLREGLGPFVARELKANFRLVSKGRLDRMADDAALKDRPIEQWDVAALLKVMEATWNDVFRPILGSRTERSLVSELLDWRNKWPIKFRFPVKMRIVRWTLRNGFSDPSMHRRRKTWGGSGGNCSMSRCEQLVLRWRKRRQRGVQPTVQAARRKSSAQFGPNGIKAGRT